jgi:integrase
MPASSTTIAAFLADQAAAGRAPSTVSLRAAAIAFAHRTNGLPSPCDAAEVAETLRGIRRHRALERQPTKRAAALTVERLAACIATLDGETLRGKRDAALLTLGFALGARRSELVALDLPDVIDDGSGLHVTIHRGKTDQIGEGAELYVPLASNPQLCAVRAVRSWLMASGLTEGALLRSIVGRNGVRDRLTDRSVDLVVRRCAKRAGLDAEGRYSAHSLRAGLVTTLAERGRTEVEIMRQSRHKSSAMVRSYTRPLDAKQGCPLRGAF